MRGVDRSQLQDLYDASTPEVRKWMSENVGEWGKEKGHDQ